MKVLWVVWLVLGGGLIVALAVTATVTFFSRKAGESRNDEIDVTVERVKGYEEKVDKASAELRSFDKQLEEFLILHERALKTLDKCEHDRDAWMRQAMQCTGEKLEVRDGR